MNIEVYLFMGFMMAGCLMSFAIMKHDFDSDQFGGYVAMAGASIFMAWPFVLFAIVANEIVQAISPYNGHFDGDGYHS